MLPSSVNDHDQRVGNIACSSYCTGAGPAGASSAYYLSKFATEANLPVNITIFERNHYIGGRCTTVNVYDDPDLPVELGASIFVEVNQILVNASRQFNLSQSSVRGSSNPDIQSIPGPSLGVWDGIKFVVTVNGGSSWWETAKFLWKYGTAPIRTQNLMKSTTARFFRMYNSPVLPFASLTQAVRDIGLVDAVSVTGEAYMAENSITGNWGHDIVQASTRVNYAQNLKHIHGLEAMVCMATEGAMAIEGGNWQIFNSMIEASDATVLLNTPVTEVATINKGGYSISYQPSSFSGTRSQHFDHVVLATPWQYANLSLYGPQIGKDTLYAPDPHVPAKIPYVELHVTLFTSPHLLSPAFFNLPSTSAVPHSVLTTLPPSEEPIEGPGSCGSVGFFSISLLRRITNPSTGGTEYLYKIFSPEPTSDAFLARILGIPVPEKEGLSEVDVSWVYRKVWNSYPYETPRTEFERVKLGEGLWYTAGMEAFISTMETMAMMGRNVAKLIVEESAGEGASRTSYDGSS